ncbi:MAG TPA: GDP-mannose 4,6-dehydratase, partial [Gammaproteobacteria bacterium]|nr:GDP-mannose 4,6-dehydratase [Gammaproteobacteria bacterium]
MRRLLVTGGAGFIGANFVHYWVARHSGDRLVVLDALTYAGNPASLDAVRAHPQFLFVHGNICDDALVNRLMVEERIDTVVHFAAESHVDRSIAGPDAFVETNVIGTHVLLKAARRAWLDTKSASGARRFHHVSTDEVYGSLGPKDPPFTESTPYAPNSPYSASKAASDHLVRAYQHTYG